MLISRAHRLGRPRWPVLALTLVVATLAACQSKFEQARRAPLPDPVPARPGTAETGDGFRTVFERRLATDGVADALAFLGQRLDAEEGNPGTDGPRTGLAATALLIAAGYPREAEVVLTRTEAAITRERLGEDPVATEALLLRGRLLADASRFEEARDSLRGALRGALTQKSAASGAAATSALLPEIRARLAGVLAHTGDGAKALDEARLAVTTADSPATPPLEAARLRVLLAPALRALGEGGEAERLLVAAVTQLERSQTATALTTIEALAELGRVRARTGRPDVGLTHLAKAIELLREFHPDDTFRLGRFGIEVADLYAATGRDADARGLLREAAALIERARGPEHPALVGLVAAYAEIEGQRDLGTGLALLDKAAAIAAKSQLGPQATLAVDRVRGRLLLAAGRVADAAAPLTVALSTVIPITGLKTLDVLRTLREQGTLDRMQGRAAEAVNRQSSALAGFEVVLGTEAAETKGAAAELLKSHVAAGDMAAATGLATRYAVPVPMPAGG